MKTYLLLVSLYLSFAFATQAQNAIKWTPTTYLFSQTVTLTFEHAFNAQRSLNTGLNIWLLSVDASTVTSESGTASFSMFGLAPEYRFYLGKNANAPKGFYAAPYLNVNLGKLKVEIANAQGQKGAGSVKTSVIAGGGIIGYQFLISEVFVLDLFGGINYTKFNLGKVRVSYPDGTSEDANIASINIGGLLPRFGISVGFAF